MSNKNTKKNLIGYVSNSEFNEKIIPIPFQNILLRNYCKENNIISIGLSGLNSVNKTQEIATYSLFVPSKTYGMVECIHQIFHHLILDKFMSIEEWKKTEPQNMDAKNFKLW